MALSVYDSRRRGEVVRPRPRMQMQSPSVPVPPLRNPAQGMASVPQALVEQKQTAASMEGFANLLDNDPVASRELQRVEALANKIMNQERDPKKATEMVKQELMRWRTQGVRGEQ